MNATIENEWQEMINRGTRPLFEIEIINVDYLLVDLECTQDGIEFSFDSDDKEVCFDGVIEQPNKDNNNLYLLPFDDCFSLDEHLETIYSNIIEGFILPNNLFP